MSVARAAPSGTGTNDRQRQQGAAGHERRGSHQRAAARRRASPAPSRRRAAKPSLPRRRPTCPRAPANHQRRNFGSSASAERRSRYPRPVRPPTCRRQAWCSRPARRRPSKHQPRHRKLRVASRTIRCRSRPLCRCQLRPRLRRRYRPQPLELPSTLRAGEAVRCLALAVRSRYTGAVAFEAPDGMRRVVFRDGDFVTAATSVDSESLVACLIERGNLPADVNAKLGRKLPLFGRHAGRRADRPRLLAARRAMARFCARTRSG